ncbi:hypothetical protein NQ317_006391 [Molorchus minor]|uniref:Uncharacterized protein n=1 Tax=Molorchus minor TaxID=1323400 RepID=A0ABQ9J4H1_9CUCU|nr:hypothetical protein NQ317_006391 [Molorchus minor]
MPPEILENVIKNALKRAHSWISNGEILKSVWSLVTNGYVECSNDCPKIDECHMIVEDGCCKRCKGCIYNGIYHPSHTEWASTNSPCTVLRCEAGVITESDLHCYTPCANPLPPEPGKCCSTCPGWIVSIGKQVKEDILLHPSVRKKDNCIFM